MGIIRSSPDNNVKVKSESMKDLNYVSAATCGWQYYM